MALSSRSTTAPSISSVCRFSGGCASAGTPGRACRAQRLQPPDGAVEQGPDDRVGRRVPGKCVQVALDGGGCLALAHRRRPKAVAEIDIDFTASRVP